MISLETYTHSRHFELMKSWLEERGKPGLEPGMLPQSGVVADRKALAFLVRTDTPVAWIAHFACDPKLEHEHRDALFSEIVSSLERQASREGFSIIQTCARPANQMARRLRDKQFQEFGEYEFFAKKLGD